MMNPAEINIADNMIAHQIDLLRLEAHTRSQVMEILDRLGYELEGVLRGNNLTVYNRVRYGRLLSETTNAIDRYYTLLQDHVDATMESVGNVSAAHTAQTLNSSFVGVSIDASLPTEAFLARIASNALIEGAPSATWWARQAQDLAFKFSTTVRQGMIAGETIGQIVTRVAGTQLQPGIMQVAKNNARSLVHTSVLAAANESRLETFRKNSDIINGVRQLSTLDGHTTPICVAYSDQAWDLDGNPLPGTTLPFNGGPPRHWNCRSVLVPITATFRELGLNIDEVPTGQRASQGGPIKADVTMGEWLSRRTVAQQDEQLGVGRAQMWREGKITLQQLLNVQGNPLTLAQLESRYGP